jgi:hypothetical protein
MKIIKYIALICVITILHGCESIIKETYYGKTPQQFFVTEEDAFSSITGAYGQLQGYDYYGDYYWRVIEGAGGAVVLNVPTGNWNSIVLKNYTSASGPIKVLWAAMYNSIKVANNVIENVPGMDINPTVKSAIEGEALFMRGMDYFNLVRLWGPVPIHLTFTPNLNEYIVRQPVDVVYQQVIDDLTRAATLLPIIQTHKGRATKGAAYALLAKVYLTAASMKKHSGNISGAYNFVTDDQAYYQKCKEYCQKVTELNQYKLVDDYMKQFPICFAFDGTVTPAGFENSKESIFEVQLSSVSASSDLPMQILPYSKPSIQLVNGVYTTIPNSLSVRGGGYTYNDQGWGQFRLSQLTFDDFYTAHAIEDPNDTTKIIADYRMDVSFLGGVSGFVRSWKKGVLQPKDTLFTYPLPKEKRPPMDVDQMWPYLAKYQDYSTASVNQHASNFIYLRYADVLLMQAEAENELNDQSSATSHLNELMKRARKADKGVENTRLQPADYSNGLSQDSLRNAIWNERRFELMGEVHLWYDLVRTGKYVNFVKRFNDVEYVRDNKTFQQWTVEERNILFPIPETEMVLNKKFYQNPGHN